MNLVIANSGLKIFNYLKHNQVLNKL